MKLALQSFLLLCCLLLNGAGQSHSQPQSAGRGAQMEEKGAAFQAFDAPGFFDDHAFIFPPPSTMRETSILAVLDDVEDRDEEDESYHGNKPVAGISHAALCAQPRAPGTDATALRSNGRTSYRKHFAWSLQERHIVLRVFRV